MAKEKVAIIEEEPEEGEVYQGNVYNFTGDINVSGNSGPVTITINLKGVPNNKPPGGSGGG